jgi:hypothetical protein
MRRLAAVVAVLFISGSAAACDIDEVAGKIKFAAIERAAELAAQQSILLKKFRAINEHAKDPNKPLNQQLSQADLAEFTQTQTRYQSIELLQLLESNYSRDNQVVRDFYQVAQADYLGTPAPQEGEKNYLPYAFLAVMMMASQDQQIQDHLVTDPETKDCTLEMALHEIERESLGRLERLPLAQASKELTAIQMRIGGGKVDRDKLYGNDRAIFDRLQRTTFAPANREQNFITNIESLKLLARSASLKYELGKKDAVDSGGDINAVGKSVGALKLDERAKMGLNMLDKIADKYPSDWFIQKQKMAPVTEAIKKQDAARMSKKK